MKNFESKKNLVNPENKKRNYQKPIIEVVEFSASSTTVLGNCSGWKATPDPIGP